MIMTDLKFHWFLPTNGGDGWHVVGGGHGLTAGAAGRPATIPYLGQIARSAEQLGFEAALTPTGAWCEDAWVATAMLSGLSERLKFLVAFRPGPPRPSSPRRWPDRSRTSPAAGCCSTWSPAARATSSGCTATTWTRTTGTSAAASSYIVRALWTGERSTSRAAPPVEARGPRQLPDRARRSTSAGRRRPRSKSPPSTRRLSHLGRAAGGGGREDRPRARVADKKGRKLRFGIRLHTIARDTADEAWAEADRLLDGISEDQIAGSRRACGAANRRDRSGCSSSTAAPRTTSRSTPTCGPVSAWSAAVRGRRWSARTRDRRPDRGVRRGSGSPSSSSPGIRTSKRPTGSARACCPSSTRRGLWHLPAPRRRSPGRPVRGPGPRGSS